MRDENNATTNIKGKSQSIHGWAVLARSAFCKCIDQFNRAVFVSQMAIYAPQKQETGATHRQKKDNDGLEADAPAFELFSKML